MHWCDDTALDAATLRGRAGEKSSANVGGTGSVPDGRKAGADGQPPSGPRCARRKRGHRSSRSRSTVDKTGSAATAAGTAWRSGGRSRRRGTPLTWRGTAVIAKRDNGEARGRRRLSAMINPPRSFATKARHHPAHQERGRGITAPAKAERGATWECCGSRVHLDLHHQKAKRYGGQDPIENAELLCRPCHVHTSTFGDHRRRQ